jgi:hypothetical protein
LVRQRQLSPRLLGQLVEVQQIVLRLAAGHGDDHRHAVTLQAQYVVPLTFDTFQPAERVIGQATFTDWAANSGGTAAANTLNAPYTSVTIAPNGALFISDYASHRTLGFAAMASARTASSSRSRTQGTTAS